MLKINSKKIILFIIMTLFTQYSFNMVTQSNWKDLITNYSKTALCFFGAACAIAWAVQTISQPTTNTQSSNTKTTNKFAEKMVENYSNKKMDEIFLDYSLKYKADNISLSKILNNFSLEQKTSVNHLLKNTPKPTLILCDTKIGNKITHALAHKIKSPLFQIQCKQLSEIQNNSSTIAETFANAREYVQFSPSEEKTKAIILINDANSLTTNTSTTNTSNSYMNNNIGVHQYINNPTNNDTYYINLMNENLLSCLDSEMTRENANILVIVVSNSQVNLSTEFNTIDLNPDYSDGNLQ